MSLFAPFQTGCLIVFALLLVGAAWQDLRTMHIADALSLAIVACFALWAASGLVLGTVSLSTIGLALACAAALFGVAAAAFAAGALGGGDVKLAAAASLFAGPALMVDFLMITALVGGVLGLAILAGAPIGTPAAAAAGEATTIRTRLRGGLPYGPAIAAGGLWVATMLALR
jgi:prepilin peptidase CpaA